MDKIKQRAQQAQQALAGQDNDLRRKPPSKPSKPVDPAAGKQSKDPSGPKEAPPRGDQDVDKEPTE
jgi:hypothetical protein